MSDLALPLLVLQLTGSATRAGLVGTVGLAIVTACRLPAGVLADRFDRRRLLIVCDAIRLVGYAALAWAVMAKAATLPVILAVVAASAAATAVFSTTEYAAVRALVEPEHIVTAVARNEARSYGTTLAGPPLGGLLFGVGRALPFLGNTLSYAFSLGAVLFIRRPLQQPRPRPEVGQLGGDTEGGEGGGAGEAAGAEADRSADTRDRPDFDAIASGVSAADADGKTGGVGAADVDGKAGEAGAADVGRKAGEAGAADVGRKAGEAGAADVGRKAGGTGAADVDGKAGGTRSADGGDSTDIDGRVGPGPGPGPETGTGTGTGAGGKAASWQGVRFVLANPFLRSLIAIATPLNMAFTGMIFALTISLRRAGLPPALIGVATMTIGVGGLLGAFLAPALQRRLSLPTLIRLICWSTAGLMAISVLLSPSIAAAVPMAIAVFLGPTANAALFGYQAAVTPDHLQGRVVSVILLAASSAAALAPTVAGFLLAHIAGHTALLIFPILVAASAAVATSSSGITAMAGPGAETAPSSTEPPL